MVRTKRKEEVEPTAQRSNTMVQKGRMSDIGSTVTIEREEKVTVTLPDLGDSKAVEAFIAPLRKWTHQHGVKRLIEACEQIVRHTAFVQRFTGEAERAAMVVNGNRTPLQVEKDQERSKRAIADKFYRSLSYESLKEECAFFDVPYNMSSLSSYDDIITALVTAHIDRERGV